MHFRREITLDAAVVAVISVAICTASDRLAAMTILVPALLATRMALWSRLPSAERRHGAGTELALVALCTVLGGFNDWNSVVRHRVYEYAVPHHFPALSTIPIWMLLYWGMILRFLISLFRWKPLSGSGAPANRVGLPGARAERPVLKVALELGLVLATRQAIYRLHDDPVLSWIPFGVALGLHILLFGLDRHDGRLLVLFAIGGPLIEVLYIQVGDLHRYRHGWLGGVPVWIALWWLLAALIWKDLSGRLLRVLEGSSSGPSPVADPTS